MPSAKRTTQARRAKSAKDAKPPELCLKCLSGPGTKSFGLCDACYRAMPERTRERLDRLSSAKINPAWNDDSEPSPAARASDAEPGSFEKVLILAERIAKGFDPWHEDDAGEPVDMVTALNKMGIEHIISGVAYCNWNRGFRVRPWWDNERFHLGYYQCQEHAVSVVREWRDLAARIGPKKAQNDIRRKWAWARYPLFKSAQRG